MIVVDIDTLGHEGALEPPGEVFIHSEAYKARPEINAVVHAHSEMSVALSIAGQSVLPIHYYSDRVLVRHIYLHSSGVEYRRSPPPRGTAIRRMASGSQRSGVSITEPDPVSPRSRRPTCRFAGSLACCLRKRQTYDLDRRS
ncbi:MAG: hypothetical protein GEU71_06790 [Actinobacteria bacterium]|nr:hypothetical protein [Actinomycetota bacterium]